MAVHSAQCLRTWLDMGGFYPPAQEDDEVESLLSSLLDESGATSVEYAIALALIVAVILITVMSIGAGANDIFRTIGDSIYSG